MPSLLRFIARNIAPPPSGAGADRDERAVLAAADPLDADHLGAEIAEQRGAERPGDIAAEIENADAVEYAGQGCLPCLESALFLIKGTAGT